MCDLDTFSNYRRIRATSCCRVERFVLPTSNCWEHTPIVGFQECGTRWHVADRTVFWLSATTLASTFQCCPTPPSRRSQYVERNKCTALQETFTGNTPRLRALHFRGADVYWIPALAFQPSKLTTGLSGRTTWFLRKAAASSLEHRLICRVVRSVVAFWFATPRTPPLWQRDFILVNYFLLR